MLTDIAPIEAQRARTMAVVESLSHADLARIHPDSGWTVGQLLGHIAGSELGSAFFVRRAAQGDLIEMDLASRDQFNDLETEKALAFDLRALKGELADSAEALREVFSELSEQDLEKPIVWPEWPARTIGESIPYMVEHEAEHLVQIEDAISAA
ncbi:MAG TPA: DinB family protein [Candidatus Dormibacteraeota bacterium]